MDLASPAVSGTSVYANGLTSQRKLTLAESYDFPMVVNKGQYIFKVCQIPNHTLSYCQGTAPCGDVKYLAK